MDVFRDGAEWFWQMCQVPIIAITGLLIYRQLKLQNDTHLINSLSVLNEQWNSQPMLKARRRVCKAYTPGNKSMDYAAKRVAIFFEELGVYCNRRAVDRDIVWEVFSFEVEHYWPILQNCVLVARKEANDKTFYHNFERLHRDLLRINRKKGAPTDAKTPEDLQKFIKFEEGLIEFI